MHNTCDYGILCLREAAPPAGGSLSLNLLY
nr:MAG TPA: hypothetical protein [Caudoviricetes sp.]